MKSVLKILVIIYATSIYSQQATTIGIDTEYPEGILDINSTTLGMLFPKIALQNVYDEVTVTNANPFSKLQNGTIIWNTTTATSNINNNNTKLIPGFYIWQNPRWRRLLDQNSLLQNSSLGYNTPNFNATNCSTSTWTELTSNLGTSFSLDEDEISTISFYYNEPQNYICEVEVVLEFKNKQVPALEMFLKSPTGDIIELMDNDGPQTIAIERTFSSTFTSNSSNSLDAWTAFNGNFTLPNVKPKGITNPSILSSHFSKSSINSFNDLVNKNPQGEWEIIVNNRSLSYTMDISNIKLRIKAREDYSDAGNYKLAKQIAFNTKNSNALVLHSIFEGQVKSNLLHTVITKTTTPITVTSTNDISTLNIQNVNTKMNTGISWVQSNNQLVDKNLAENTTYYYQLWYKADIQNNNIMHNITVNGFAN
jgi:hypothetical protein